MLAVLETRLSRHECYQWFRPTSCDAVAGGTLRVTAPPLVAGWIQRHYHAELAAALASVAPGYAVEWTVTPHEARA